MTLVSAKIIERKVRKYVKTQPMNITKRPFKLNLAELLILRSTAVVFFAVIPVLLDLILQRMVKGADHQRTIRQMFECSYVLAAISFARTTFSDIPDKSFRRLIVFMAVCYGLMMSLYTCADYLNTGLFSRRISGIDSSTASLIFVLSLTFYTLSELIINEEATRQIAGFAYSGGKVAALSARKYGIAARDTLIPTLLSLAATALANHFHPFNDPIVDFAIVFGSIFIVFSALSQFLKAASQSSPDSDESHSAPSSNEQSLESENE